MENSFTGVYSGSSELGVDVVGKISGMDMATSHVELHTVGAQRGILMRLGITFIGNVTMGVVVIVVDIGTTEMISVIQLSLTACKKGTASWDHRVSESKLLAEKNEGILVGIKLMLGVAARVLQVMHIVLSSIGQAQVSCLVLVDIILIGSNSTGVDGDIRVDFIKVVIEVSCGLLESFKSDKQLSLNLDSFFVVLLVPNAVA